MTQLHAVELLPEDVYAKYSFVNASIGDVASKYKSSILQIQSLGRLPTLLTGASWMTATFDMVARHELHAAYNDPRLDPEAMLFDPQLMEMKERIRIKLQQEWFQKSNKNGEKSGPDIGEEHLAHFKSYENAELSEGLSAILIGMVTGMWTSFEVLAEDLWHAAIKCRPTLLHQNWTSKQKNESGFRSIKKLRKQYEYTFQDDADIQKTIGDERIEGLALTRNLLVHALGKIDQEFDKRRPSIPSLNCFNLYQLHQEVTITGPIVQQLITPLPILGLDLIRHVDQWITTHP